MLEYTKTILGKVSFDGELFKKELIKSFRWLDPNEVINLKFWVQQVFGHLYGTEINDVFMSYSMDRIAISNTGGQK